MSQRVIEATSGSDIRLQMVVGDDTLDLEDFTPTVISQSHILEGRITVSWIDVGQRLVEVFIEGTDPLTTGTYSFQVQFNSPVGDSFATPAIPLRIFR
jgi:hypothetical protein